MRLINEITSEPNQNHRFALEDGTDVNITFNYRVNQSGWFYSFTHEGRTFNNRRIVTSPNMIRQFKDILPFGFACTVEGGGEPIFQDDFELERAKFYLLDQSDVQSVEDDIINV